MTRVVHLTHSKDLRTGGVIEAVLRLDESMREQGVESYVTDDPLGIAPDVTQVISHGLWQWPGVVARKNYLASGVPYFLFPHGMLDPWFKRAFPFKHLKKQAYWWWRQGRILRDARVVCFTTDEERRLGQGTFRPYQAKEFVTGLGVSDPPSNAEKQTAEFFNSFPKLRDRKRLLYLGRMHPKKGLDLLIRSFLAGCLEGEILVLGGPLEKPDKYLTKLLNETKDREDKIVWTGMLSDGLKWGALRSADALVLPSHQENYGMVVAEALSVGTPVFLTDKVNLWREVTQAGAGLVYEDDRSGIDRLLSDWRNNRHAGMSEASLRCFEEKLHIRNCAKRLIELMDGSESRVHVKST